MPIEMIVVLRIVKIATNCIAVTDIVTKIVLIRIGTVHMARTQVVMILNTVLQECMVLEAGLLLRHAILCKVCLLLVAQVRITKCLAYTLLALKGDMDNPSCNIPVNGKLHKLPNQDSNKCRNKPNIMRSAV
jgi:hypothetical protein